MATKGNGRKGKSHHNQSPTTRGDDQWSPKVGSEPKAVEQVGGKGDFGIPAGNRRGREYASAETRQNDKGGGRERFKVGDEARETGVGANQSGTGSGSGGDIDTDIVGVGFGAVAASGPDRTEGADMTEKGGTEPFAAAGPKRTPAKKPRRIDQVHGTTFDRSGGDLSTTGGGLDSGSASNPMARNDDSFAADIQEDEARGADNSRSDNS